MLCGCVSKSKLLYVRLELLSTPDKSARSSSQNYFGKYFRQIIASLEDPVRKVSSVKKDDFSTPHPPKDPPDPYVPDNIVHQAFDPPRKMPKTVFRKFQSPDEVLGPNADKCKDYKNPEYFSYHRYSFVNLQRASLKLRKERMQDQEEAESDAEFDAQLEAEWEAIFEKQEFKCPTDKPTELKCVEDKKVDETVQDIPAKECQPEAKAETEAEVEVSETVEKTSEEAKEDEECRKQREEECKKERQKEREEEACREAEEQRIEEEKQKKREERKQIEAECKKKAEENLRALEARKSAEKKPSDEKDNVKVQVKGEEEIKKEKAKQELELRKMVEKCKKEIIHKKRIEDKCKRVAEERLREEKCRAEVERNRKEIDAKNAAEHLKKEEEKCKLKTYKEICMKASALAELEQKEDDKPENEANEIISSDIKAEAAGTKDSKQCLESVPPDVIYNPGAAVCDTKSEEEKAVPSDSKNKKDD